MRLNVKHKTAKFLKKIALNAGVSIEKTAPVEKLKAFFSKVKPVTTNCPLVRIGPADDAGYIVPDVLEGIKTCFSPGVSDKSGFEDALAGLGIRSFLADYSVDGPPVNNPMFTFVKKFVGSENNDLFMTLSTWINESVDSSEDDMILQMDIEDSEYDVIIETPNTVFKRFRIIIIEFHVLQQLFNPFGLRVISACFDKLLENFKIVHIHPNNNEKLERYKGFEVAPVMEFTFLRNDLIKWHQPTTHFPHVLDRKNVEGLADIVLPDCWYK